MNRLIEDTLNEFCGSLDFFEQAFLFGSSLHSDAANDIDILLVYDEDSLELVRTEKARVKGILVRLLGNICIDFTVLSSAELEQTKFLEKTPHLKLKG